MEADAIKGSRECASRPLLEWAVVLAAFATIFSSRALLVATFGNITPYWDQWDGEAIRLFKPYLEGTLRWSAFLQPHNEHRIFFTRLISLVELEIAGMWDVRFQMLVNAALWAVAYVLVLCGLTRGAVAGRRTLVIGVASLIATLPFAWENVLGGFQSQFAVLVILSFLGLMLSFDQPIGSNRWCVGAALTLASFLASASGALSPVALSALMLFQWVLGVRKGWREGVGAAILFAVAAVLMGLTPKLEQNNSLMAHSLHEFAPAMLAQIAWPIPVTRLPDLLKIGFATFANAPVLIVSVRVLTRRSDAWERHWLLLAVFGWLLLQAAATAYGRALVPLSSRYLDIDFLFFAVNSAAVLHLLMLWPQPGRHVRGAIGLWGCMMFFAFMANLFTGHVHREILERASTSTRHTANVTAYYATGNADVLKGPGPEQIPYSDGSKLKSLLDDATIRMLLPLELTGLPSHDELHARLILRGVLADAVNAIVAFMLKTAWLVMTLSVTGLITVTTVLARSRASADQIAS